MIIGTANISPPPLLTISNSPVERVTRCKSLGINICNNLRWDAHVDALCSKVASTLHFLKLLKRSGLSADNLLCFYKSFLFQSMVQLYGINTLQILKVINSRPCKTWCPHNSLPSYSTIYNCPWISKTGVTQTPSNG